MSPSDPISVLILADHPDSYWPGSATLYIQRHLPQAIAASAATVSVSLYTPYRRRDLIRWLFAPVTSEELAGVQNVRAGILPLCFHLLRARYALVHCLVIRNYMLWPAAVSRLVGKNVAVTLHDTLFLQRTEPLLVSFVKRVLFRNADALLTMAKSDEERVEEERGQGIAMTVRNGIADVGVPLSPNNSRQILFGGGIGNDHAGLDFLEQSLAGMEEQPKLRIFGTNTGPTPHPKYEGMVERSRYHAVMRIVRATVVPSRYESFSMTTLESLAMGIPVIISDRCGITRYLTDGTDCLIVRYDDVDGMRNALRRIMTDDVLWQHLSTQGQRTAERFLWSTVAQDHVNAYASVAGRKG